MSGYYRTETYTYDVEKSREDFIGFNDIKVCRPKLIYFKVTGLRPNTRHFAFFDNTDVTNYINTSISTINEFKALGRNDIRRNPGEKYINETGFPTELGGPTGSIYSDDEGKIEGVYYLQSNSSLNFPAGTRTLSFIDISTLSAEQALSYANGIYSANGGIENYKITYYTVQKTGTRQVWVDTPNRTQPSNNSGGGSSTGSSNNQYSGPTLVSRHNGSSSTYYYPGRDSPSARTPTPRPSASSRVPKSTHPGRPGGEANERGGDTVICTALHSLGMLPDDIYELDAQFGTIVNTNDPMLADGYRLWATPVAEYIKGDSIGSKLALAFVAPLAKAWAHEMAHIMKPDDYKTNIVGKTIMIIGHPICRMIGNLFLEKQENTNDISS